MRAICLAWALRSFLSRKANTRTAPKSIASDCATSCKGRAFWAWPNAAINCTEAKCQRFDGGFVISKKRHVSPIKLTESSDLLDIMIDYTFKRSSRDSVVNILSGHKSFKLTVETT